MPITPPKPRPGTDPVDTKALQALCAHLEGLVDAAARNVCFSLQAMLEKGKRGVIDDLREDPEVACLTLLTAALLLEAERVGPKGGRLSFYIPREMGSSPQREKARIDRYRKLLEQP